MPPSNYESFKDVVSKLFKLADEKNYRIGMTRISPRRGYLEFRDPEDIIRLRLPVDYNENSEMIDYPIHKSVKDDHISKIK